MLVADAPCVAVGTFTTSQTPSHTVILCKEHLAASGLHGQAVVVNSGNANCANGERGMRDAARMAELTAQKFGVDPNLVYVSSTGIIGRPLPMEKVERGIAQIEVRPDGGHEFARGIMTTDTRPKTIAVEFEVGGKTVRLGGSTKGAGMIYPNMATMLCYLTTTPPARQSSCRPSYARRSTTRSTWSAWTATCPPTTPSCSSPTAWPSNEPLTADRPTRRLPCGAAPRHPLPGARDGARRRGRDEADGRRSAWRGL